MLGAHEPPPVEVVNARGRAPCLLVCDHASPRLPEALGDLGVSAKSRREHIAWDIGAADITRRLSALFDAPAVLAGYSRLVVDCNRYVDDAGAFVHRSDGIVIDGNTRMSDAERDERIAAIYRPYHDAIDRILGRFDADGISPAFLSMHTMTARLRNEKRRAEECAVCWALDERFSQPILDRMRNAGLVVGDNEPYGLEPGIDYTVPEHAMRRGLAHLQLEVRQDLVSDGPGVNRWARLIHRTTSDLVASPETRRPRRCWP